jgi:nickel-type superoxide dismutase maturation protease
MMLHRINLYLFRTIWITGNIVLGLLLVRFFIIGIGVVDGHSMDPTMQSGQIFFTNKFIYLFHEPRVNDIVQAYRPDAPSELIVKRVSAIPSPHTYFLTGDNTNFSTDSRSFGPVPRTLIKGRVVSW